MSSCGGYLDGALAGVVAPDEVPGLRGRDLVGTEVGFPLKEPFVPVASLEGFVRMGDGPQGFFKVFHWIDGGVFRKQLDEGREVVFRDDDTLVSVVGSQAGGLVGSRYVSYGCVKTEFADHEPLTELVAW